MDIPEGLIPASWLWVANVLYSVLLWLAIRHAEWGRLWRHRTLQHIFGGSVAALIFLWQLRVGILPGLEIHFLGLTALTLTMGWSLSVVASSIALLAAGLADGITWPTFATVALLTSILPISVSYLAYVVERLVGFRPFFAYIFICAFFGAAFAIALSSLGKGVLLWAAGAYSMHDIIQQYLIYVPLIVFPEGIINGTVVTGVLVYVPQYLKTFNQQRYEVRR